MRDGSVTMQTYDEWAKDNPGAVEERYLDTTGHFILAVRGNKAAWTFRHGWRPTEPGEWRLEFPDAPEWCCKCTVRFHSNSEPRVWRSSDLMPFDEWLEKNGWIERSKK